MKNIKIILLIFLIHSVFPANVFSNECNVDNEAPPEELPKNKDEYFDSVDEFRDSADNMPEDGVGGEGPSARGTSINFNILEKQMELTEFTVEAAGSLADSLFAITFILLGIETAIEILSSNETSALDKATAALYWLSPINIIMADIDLLTHVVQKRKAINKVNDKADYVNHLDHYKDNPKEDQEFDILLDNVRTVIGTNRIADSIAIDIADVELFEQSELIDEIVDIKETLYPLYANQIIQTNIVYHELWEIMPYAVMVGVVPYELYREGILSDETQSLCRIDGKNNIITLKPNSQSDIKKECVLSIVRDYAKQASYGMEYALKNNVNHHLVSPSITNLDSDHFYADVDRMSEVSFINMPMELGMHASSSWDIVEAYMWNFNNFAKGAVLRSADKLHGALIKATSNTLEVYNEEAELIIAEAKVLLEVDSREKFLEKYKLNSRGERLTGSCWQEERSCVSAYKHCLDNNSSIYCMGYSFVSNGEICKGTGNYDYICETFVYDPDKDTALVKAKAQLDEFHSDILSEKTQCEVSGYQDCFSNDLLKPILDTDIRLNGQDVYEIMEYTALEVIPASLSKNPSFLIHQWGENDRIANIGDIFMHVYAGEIAFYELTNLGHDIRYWYFPRHQGNNFFWTYRGQTLTEVSEYNEDVKLLVDNITDFHIFDLRNKSIHFSPVDMFSFENDNGRIEIDMRNN